MVRFIPVSRPKYSHFWIHEHCPPGSFIKQRLGDSKDGVKHQLVWNFNKQRVRWEAMCEHSDVIFYSPDDPQSDEIKDGRTL